MIAFITFLVVGGVGLCITLGITYVLTEVLHLWYFWSYLIATVLAWTFVFFANALFTFSTDGRSHLSWKRYITFMLGYLLVFWINAGSVYVLTSILAIPYLISITLGTIATTCLTFLLSKFIIFSAPNKGAGPFWKDFLRGEGPTS